MNANRRPGGRSARVREAVLSAVVLVLQEEGFGGLTVGAVARRAGVHRTTVHRRWESRAALVADAMLRLSEAQVGVPDTGSLRGDLRRFARAVRDAIDSPLAFGLLSAFVESRAAGELAEVRDRFWRARFEGAGAIVDRAARRGEVRARAPGAFVVEAVGGPVWFRTFVVGRRADDRFCNRIADVVCDGMAGAGT